MTKPGYYNHSVEYSDYAYSNEHDDNTPEEHAEWLLALAAGEVTT